MKLLALTICSLFVACVRAADSAKELEDMRAALNIIQTDLRHAPDQHTLLAHIQDELVDNPVENLAGIDEEYVRENNPELLDYIEYLFFPDRLTIFTLVDDLSEILKSDCNVIAGARKIYNLIRQEPEKWDVIMPILDAYKADCPLEEH